MAKPTEPEEFICDLCGRQFDTVSDLEAHKETHIRLAKLREEEQQDIRGDIGAAGLPTSPDV